MDVNLIELLLVCAGSGGVTGGVTLAGVRVHIQYLREQDRRHEAENEAIRARIEAAEKDAVQIRTLAKTAHQRIDKLEQVTA